MPGNKQKSSLGRALVKDRFGATRGKRTVDNGSMLHTTEVQDGYDWGRLNLQSVTEESSFQEFLSTAQLAGTEFQAEKLNLRMVPISGMQNGIPIMTPEARASTEKRHAAAKHLLRVPRRPAWSKDMSAETLQGNERQAFLNWRRDLATLQEREGLLLTPYEKNLEFWRQLWRVLEKSQLLVQVIDARNPLLFRCEDLEAYAKEVGNHALLLLLNKADLLSEVQRQVWAEYFDKEGIKVAFFSAALAMEQAKQERKNAENQDDTQSSEDSDSEDSESDEEEVKVNKEVECDDKTNESPEKEENTIVSLSEEIDRLELDLDKTVEKLKKFEDSIVSAINKPLLVEKILQDPSEKKSVTFTEESAQEASGTVKTGVTSDAWNEKNKADILSKEQLVELMKSARAGGEGRLAVGLVGYPNVGKSSTINALMDAKKVSVSATPGKTKHFQTLLLSDDLMLCDCPGLVLPSFVSTKSEMVVHGILPIDQMREYMEAVGLLVEGLESRRAAERRLCLLLPPPPQDDPEALPPQDLLLSYAYSRGMMTGRGVPDCARAARAVLRAGATGRLPLAVPPPGCDTAAFRAAAHPPLPPLPVEAEEAHRREFTPQEKRALKTGETGEDLDNAFFKGNSQGAHAKGVPGKFTGLPTARMVNGSAVGGEEEGTAGGKPWKKINKHINKNKKVKLRKTYFFMDKH